jgi:uncharacterized protein YggE
MQSLTPLKVSFFTILFVFGFFYLFSALFGPLPFSITSITTNKTDLFTVSGEGKATATPDTAMLSLGVTKQANSVKTAQEQVNEVSNKISSDLKALGVKVTDIKTTNYSVNPNYDFTNGKQTITGYVVSQNVEIKLQPIDQANKAIDIATQDGANTVGGVSFILDDATQDKLEMQARKEAIDNAKKKAQETAQLAGIKLGKIINVSESSNQIPRPMYAMDAKAVGSEGLTQPTTLQPGENNVSITITLSYQTL